MLTGDELMVRRDAIGYGDLAGALAFHQSRLAVLRETLPEFPREKALLSRDGGVCQADGAPLIFDPWSGERHRCSKCGTPADGERHRRHWARSQHLWLAERAAELAATGAMADDAELMGQARKIIQWYGENYLEFPNADNVLGPARVFFSTYLESIWLTNLLGASVILREQGALGDAAETATSVVADEAAAIIGDFDEGLSNRQTWNDAALLAVAAWFHDEALAERAIESPTGLIAHLLHGFRSDGMWYEGDHYHFFAMQGLLTGAGWARMAGFDFFDEPMLAERLGSLLTVSRLTALPDGTYPARKDARFGVALNQPMHLESWELGLAGLLASGSDGSEELAAWLGECYGRPAASDQHYDSYLHEAGWDSTTVRRDRTRLSWRTLLEMVPELPVADPAPPRSVLLEAQGLAVLRCGDSYASLECGAVGGGHGHADRLHLTYFSDGVQWLPDPGTASYLTEDLQYYRSSLAHNAPSAEGQDQPRRGAELVAFDAGESWSWARGRFEQYLRTVVVGPDYLLDVLEAHDEDGVVLDLPWHLAGEFAVTVGGDAATWEPADYGASARPGITRSQRAHGQTDVLSLVARADEAQLAMSIRGAEELWRLTGPGTPREPAPADFLVCRGSGRRVRLITVISRGSSPATLEHDGDLITVVLEGRRWSHQPVSSGWQITGEAGRVRLGGLVPPTKAPTEYPKVAGPHVPVGWSEGYRMDHPEPDMERSTLVMDHEDQYRRSEQPYPGTEQLSAWANVGWNDEALHLDVVVRKDELCFRQAEAASLQLDNDPDDIHSDGLQVYLASPVGAATGWLVVPATSGQLRVTDVAGEGKASHGLTGEWGPVKGGYRVVMRLTPSWWDLMAPGDVIGFDLLVNEMRPGRIRRSGQLVWSGGGGWVWLRGAGQPPEHFGRLELIE